MFDSFGTDDVCVCLRACVYVSGACLLIHVPCTQYTPPEPIQYSLTPRTSQGTFWPPGPGESVWGLFQGFL